MRSRPTRRFSRLALPAALLVIGISGCTGTDLGAAPSTGAGLLPSTPSPSVGSTGTPAVQAVDHRALLLSATDISDAEDTFHERSRNVHPNDIDGASAFFVNDQDNRAVSDTIQIYPDAATATATLRTAAGTLPTQVTGGNPAPIGVGNDGVVIAGAYPDQAKAVTVLLFTEGRALVRLEFQSATGDTTTDDFVTSVGKMQQIALRVGLSEA